MESVEVRANPFELEVEWDIDQDHVEALKRDIKIAGGVLVPVLVWLRNNRIIDGFHRTKAAQELQLDSIPVTLADVTESRFWDLRIVSARKHKTIEKKRLKDWMLEAWGTSKWGKYDIVEKLDQTLGHYRFKETGSAGIGYAGITEQEHDEITVWLADKSQKWGTTSHDIIYTVLMSSLKDSEYSAPEVRFISQYFNRASFSTLQWAIGKVHRDMQERRQEVEAKPERDLPTIFETSTKIMEDLLAGKANMEDLEYRNSVQYTLDAYKQEIQEDLARELEKTRREEEYHANSTPTRVRAALRSIAVDLQSYRVICQDAPKLDKDVSTGLKEIVHLCAGLWGEEFAVWDRRMNPEMPVITHEQMVQSSSEYGT